MDRKEEAAPAPVTWDGKAPRTASDLVGMMKGMQPHVLKQVLESCKFDPDDRHWMLKIDDNTAYAPLHIACSQNWTPVVQVLLDLKADVNIRDADGRTPLMSAVSHPNMVRRLLDSGANPHIVDREDLGVLHIAAHKCKTASSCKGVKALVRSHNLDVEGRDAQGMTPLGHALAQGNETFVTVLLSCSKADLNAVQRTGWLATSSINVLLTSARLTAASAATGQSAEQMITSLVASSSLKLSPSLSEHGRTAAHFAVDTCDLAALRFIVATWKKTSHKWMLLVSDFSGMTALDLARISLSPELCRLRHILPQEGREVQQLLQSITSELLELPSLPGMRRKVKAHEDCARQDVLSEVLRAEKIDVAAAKDSVSRADLSQVSQLRSEGVNLFAQAKEADKLVQQRRKQRQGRAAASGLASAAAALTYFDDLMRAIKCFSKAILLIEHLLPVLQGINGGLLLEHTVDFRTPRSGAETKQAAEAQQAPVEATSIAGTEPAQEYLGALYSNRSACRRMLRLSPGTGGQPGDMGAPADAQNAFADAERSVQLWPCRLKSHVALCEAMLALGRKSQALDHVDLLLKNAKEAKDRQLLVQLRSRLDKSRPPVVPPPDKS